MNGHLGTISALVFSSDGKFIVSGSNDKTIKIWNLEEKNEEFSLDGHSGSVQSVSFSPDCKFLASGSTDKTIKIWNFEERKEELTLMATHILFGQLLFHQMVNSLQVVLVI